MKTLYWRLLPLIVFTLLVGFFWRGLSLEPQKLPSVQLGKPLPDFKLPMLGEEKIFRTSSMQGRVTLLNVWASWCSACVDEQVFLMRLSRESVPIYGLNYKDNTENARRWLSDWGNPYQAIGEDRDGIVAIDLGVYGAPETFLIDKQGIIRYRHVGVLDEATWKSDFLPRIKQLEGEV
jgi:cytochrome c biogenesis protein CcmG/thiol:disulfide interchange protein DsbE